MRYAGDRRVRVLLPEWGMQKRRWNETKESREAEARCTVEKTQNGDEELEDRRAASMRNSEGSSGKERRS